MIIELMYLIFDIFVFFVNLKQFVSSELKTINFTIIL